jgi:hypothetical protein
MSRVFSSLALGGGGARGGLQVGALAALESRRGDLVFPNGIYGCSIGSILATAVAFRLSAAQIRDMYNAHFNLDGFLPSMKLTTLVELPTKKGLFSMDTAEQTILRAFDSQGIDLRNKTLQDSPQPLYIIASNMTTQVPNIFAKHVRILDALKCSSCIPLVFQPQILYNQVYLDGGLFLDDISSVVPEDALLLHISPSSEPIFPADLESMSIPTYIHRMYRGMRKPSFSKNTIWLQNSTVGILQDLTPEEKQELFTEGYLQTTTFLAKRFPEELE